MIGPEKVIGIPRLPECGLRLRAVLSHIEMTWVTQAMEMTGGSATRAGRLLGIRRTALISKLRAAGLWERWRSPKWDK
jgi:DNA-binding NtrC family response regulator